MLFKPSEKGQGLVEYALILILVAIVVIAALGCLWFVILGPIIIANWPAISAWGANLISGIREGNSSAIFTGIVILLVILWIIFGRRRRA